MSVDNRQFRVVAIGNCATLSRVVAREFAAEVLGLTATGSVAEVLAELDAVAADLVLLDADLETPPGLELCRALKEHPGTMLLPVVAVSRSARRRLAAFDAGADDFVTPHVRREFLQTRVAALARSGAARRSLAQARLAAEIQQREQIRQMFRRYVSPQLADKILGDTELRDSVLAAGDARTRAVVMFADMRGFTAIAEQLSPDAVVPLLNEYFSLLTEVAFQYDGTVFNMAGDCLMVGFGVPLPQNDSPERAMRAAREMLERFRHLAAAWKRRHEVDTGLGIGINEGDVVAGNVGSPIFMNYTIIGDTVNIASRLCQRARAGEVVFSRALKDSLEARGLRVGAMELPPMTLRGRSHPIDIYCVPLEKRLDLGGPENREEYH